jgi:peptidoglycan/xylan/chitin deacetylase (PgdA/CDA1 family)
MKKQRIAAVFLALLLTGCGDTAVKTDGTVLLEEEIKYVALTFDDGPRPGTTDVLLDGLKERGAAATFFLVGEEIAGNEVLIERMGAEGHQVGNHTWSHQRLETAAPETVSEEIKRTDEAIGAILGGSGYWLRLPYGLLPEQAHELITVPVIKWSVDPRDWESREKWAIVNAVMKDVQSGSIILLHDIYPASVEAALEIVDRLQAQGYWFVTVEELLRIQGIDARPGILYRSAAS